MLLIDEIDKADIEFPNDLLQELDRMEFHAGGSIEHMNEEAGAVWLKRLTDAYPSAAWINPTPEAYWGHSASTAILRRLMDERMYGLTLDGLDEAMRELSRKR